MIQTSKHSSGYVRFVNVDQSKFFITLQNRVGQYFKDRNISKQANGAMVLKTFVLFTMYLLPFIFILIFQPSFWSSLVLWSIMGLGVAGLGMSVMHDMNHGAYFSNKKLNEVLGQLTLNVLGASALHWRMQHNVLHHTYTNIAGIDGDIKDVPLFHFSPHGTSRPINRFQHIYAFLIYGITNLHWVTVKDFILFAKSIKNGANHNGPLQNTVNFLKIILVKALYFFVMLVMPTLIFGLSFGEILLGFVIMHVIAGFILIVTFQLSHQVDEAHFPLPNEEGIIENSWAIHQMNTTVNFSRHNKWISWYVGGLNFQIEHHLFPAISHVHYPKIAPIVKATAEEFGIPYLENRTLWEALRSHTVALKRHGRLPDLNQVMG